jgi:two-component system, NtrC family, response regulator AtoC
MSKGGNRTDPDSTRRELEETVRRTQARVAAYWDGGSSSAWLAPGGSLAIGRGTDADLSISHGSVSRRHAVIGLGKSLTIEDLGSSNGVRVRGERIPLRTTVAVRPGDLIELGPVIIAVQMPHAGPETDADPSSTRVHDPMHAVWALIDLVAKSNISVILLGETGVGKGVAAERIHERSDRSSGRLVRLNCAAFPEALLEAELFGFERGAFTGAQQSKPGLMEAADGGTLFLDELGELAPATQAKLLMVVEEREVRRLGATEPRHVNLRFVSATNRILEDEIRAGRFREDLYFRLNGISIWIPPLRERKAEILTLAKTFVESAHRQAAVPGPGFSDAALDWMLANDWPGNVRELKSAVERACVLSQGGTISVEHLDTRKGRPVRDSELPTKKEAGDASVPARAVGDLRAEVEAFERQRVEAALERCAGNQTRAAKLLGISRQALIDRLESYGVPRPRKPKRTHD